MSLLDPGEFEHIFAPLKDCEVGFIPYPGNVEYQLTNKAAEQLLFDYHIQYREIKPQEIRRGDLYQPLDAILVSGGGRMTPSTRQHIRNALTLGVPVTILPLSVNDKGEDIAPYENFYVSDRASLKLVQDTKLAPELALALRHPWVDEGVEADIGIWLRDDNERTVEYHDFSLGDPIDISWSTNDYFGLASKFEHIVTNCLYFAIAGLLINRHVTLLPNANGINRTIYETWLKDLGCRWRNGLSGIKTNRDEVVDKLWKRLSSPPSGLIAWNTLPCRNEDWEFIQTGETAMLRSPDKTELILSPTAMVVWSLCDGNVSVEDICNALSEHYQQPLLVVARDVQPILHEFQQQSVIKGSLQSDKSVNRQSPSAAGKRKYIDVDITPPRKKHGRIRWSAKVQGTSLGDFIHYFEFDARWRSALTKRADPFLLALLPRAMKDDADLRISGAPVDSQLLDHLDEYQQAWHSWESENAKPVSILAEETTVSTQNSRPALTAFSGGLDSMHTIARHCMVPDGRRNRRLEAALMASGFDIPVNDRDGFSDAIERLRPATDDAGIDLIEVHTNVRSHIPSWVTGHGAALASVLCLFSGRFGTGIIPSTFSYRHMSQWGSNPISDPLLGGAFVINHDSAALSRFDKLCAVARWPVASQRLRVCWMNRDSAKNCGHCEKCLGLAIGMQALGMALDCFDKTPEPSLLTNYAKKISHSGIENSDFSSILEYAKRSGLRETWVDVLY